MPVISDRREDLVESSAQPTDFDGVITRVVAAPFDWGSEFGNKPKKYKYRPYSLASYIHYLPDDGEEFFAPVQITRRGGLRFNIAATANISTDEDCRESDIKYPGDPIAETGLDMELMFAELNKLWTVTCKGDTQLYRQAMMDKWGGPQPFNIGRPRKGLDKGTDWEFWLSRAEKLPGFLAASKAKFPNGAQNANELLTGVRGHFERLDLPSWDTKKTSAMKDGEQERVFQLLCMTGFEKYVDVDAAVASKPASAPDTTSDGDLEEKVRSLIQDALIDSETGEIDKKKIRKVSLDRSVFDREQLKTILGMSVDPKFLATCGDYDVASGILK